MRYLSLALLLTACGGHSAVYSVPAEIEPMVQKFRDESAQHSLSLATNDLIVQFTNEPETNQGDREAAHCTSQNGTPLVVIHQGPWDMGDNTVKEEIIFHELGHCFLMRAHRQDVASDGTPLSLMHAELVEESAYTQNREGYMDELFDPARLGGL